MTRLPLLTSRLFAIVSAVPGMQAVATDYPSKPIRLIVPFPAGSTDVPGRMFAQRVNAMDEVKRFLAEQGAEPGGIGPGRSERV